MSVSPITWYCVADAGRARILEARVPRAALTVVETLDHEPYEHGRVEPPGRSQESATTARHSFVDAETPARREKRAFAHDVADFLAAAAERGAYGHLVIAAPPKFLGDLRGALKQPVRARVKAEIGKDLTHESVKDLAAHFRDIPDD